jgi:hypothetical protein
MNKRIKQLAKQAYEDVIKNTPSFLVTKELYEQKFAELIVEECISMADKESERYSNLDQEYCSMAMDNYRELVRKHFGVEE